MRKKYYSGKSLTIRPLSTSRKVNVEYQNVVSGFETTVEASDIIESIYEDLSKSDGISC